MKKILDFINRNGFRNGIKRQVVRIFSIALFIPTIIIGFFLSYFLIRRTLSQGFDMLNSYNLRVRSSLLDCILDINLLSDDIISDKELQNLLNSDFSEEENVQLLLNSYSPLRVYHDSKAFIEDISVFCSNPTLEEARFIKPSDSEEGEFFLSFVNYPGDYNWTVFSRENGNKGLDNYLSLVRYLPIPNSDYKAVLVVTISNNYLKNRIKNSDYYTALSLNDGNIFFSTTRSDTGKAPVSEINYEIQNFSSMGKMTYDGQKCYGFINTLSLPYCKDSIYITSFDFSLRNSLKKLVILCTAIIISSFTLSLLAVITYTKALGTRIEMLQEATHKASLGDYNIIKSFTGSDELSETFTNILCMVENVKEKEASIYEEQLRKQILETQQREMEIKLLSSQINPHFMYNTLETIRMLALSNNDTVVSDTVSLFGKTLHYILENTINSKTTIKKEIDHINSYLQIQKLRFEDRFDYEIIMPEDIDIRDCQILPLSLQPLVENTIVHGMENIDYKCLIRITFTIINQNTLQIDVSDNGSGMNDETLIALNQGLLTRQTDSHCSIALVNISKRIKLYYGNDYSLQVFHNSPSGTIARIVMPLVFPSH